MCWQNGVVVRKATSPAAFRLRARGLRKVTDPAAFMLRGRRRAVEMNVYTPCCGIAGWALNPAPLVAA